MGGEFGRGSRQQVDAAHRQGELVADGDGSDGELGLGVIVVARADRAAFRIVDDVHAAVFGVLGRSGPDDAFVSLREFRTADIRLVSGHHT